MEHTAHMELKDYLDPEDHSALLYRLDFISEQTHVSKHNLHYLSARSKCSDEEFEWVHSFKKHLDEGSAGLIISGDDGTPHITKLTSIAATMIRNGKDARVYSTGMLLSILDDRYAEVPNPTILVIPDLCSGVTLAAIQISKLYNLLLERYIGNRMTVGWVMGMNALKTLYGTAFHSLVEQHFEVIRHPDVALPTMDVPKRKSKTSA